MAGKDASKKVWIVRVAVAAVLVAALLISLIWADAIDRKFGLVKTVESAYDGNSVDEVLAPGEIGENLNVHFVDVGQGDACIIEFPDDKTMLIDAGDTKSKNKTALLSYIEENINDDEGNDITHFDYAILTHPDSDHCGGMYDVLTKYPAEVFYRPNVYSTYTKNGFTDPATNILQETNNSKNNQKDTAAYGKAIEAGYNTTKINGVETTVYITDATNEEISRITPDLPETDPDFYTFTFYAPVKNSFTDWNDYSPVMILEYRGKRFMLSGDAEKEEEASFVSLAQAGEGKYAVFDDNFNVDVLKLGHHGSRTSTGEGLLNVMTTPSGCAGIIAVVSCGEGNSYGHPHKEVLDRLLSFGFAEENIVRTDVNGNIAMRVGYSEETGKYELMMGAQTVRSTSATVGNDTVSLRWREIAIALCVVVVLLLIVLPAISQLRRASGGKGRRR